MKQAQSFHVKYLADCPEHIDTVTQWYWQEWHRDIEEWTFEETRAKVEKNSCHKTRLNITMIAFDGEKPIGTIQLMEDEFLPGWENKGPWLGALYILNEYRHSGVAYQLGYSMISKAMEMGFEHIYTFTPNLQKVLQRNHFEKVGTAEYGGQTSDIFVKKFY